jgi:hypothetical protein
MPYALELALDDRAARAVRRAWEELADAGITYSPSLGLIEFRPVRQLASRALGRR